MFQSDLDKFKIGDVISLGYNINEEIKYDSVWIEAKDNSFNKSIFDCRDCALNMIQQHKIQKLQTNFYN